MFKPKSAKAVVEKKSLAPVDRDFKPESQLGKTMIVTADMKAENVFAFYCSTCKCGLKDSQAWYDHINGKKHNQMLGMSMIVEKVSVDRVKAKLESLKQGRIVLPERKETLQEI